MMIDAIQKEDHCAFDYADILELLTFAHHFHGEKYGEKDRMVKIQLISVNEGQGKILTKRYHVFFFFSVMATFLLLASLSICG